MPYPNLGSSLVPAGNAIFLGQEFKKLSISSFITLKTKNVGAALALGTSSHCQSYTSFFRVKHCIIPPPPKASNMLLVLFLCIQSCAPQFLKVQAPALFFSHLRGPGMHHISPHKDQNHYELPQHVINFLCPPDSLDNIL